MSHTPGPWFAGSLREAGAEPEFRGIDIGAADGLNIGLVYYDPIQSTRGECRANARLISACPDLLAALECLVDAINGKHITVGDMNQAAAAIAKARGE